MCDILSLIFNKMYNNEAVAL